MDSSRIDGVSVEPRRVIICGSRYWEPHDLIQHELEQFDRERDVIIHGCANGVDITADVLARDMGFKHIKKYPAKWDIYGRAAGPIRNKKMFDENHPHLVLAFHQKLWASRGTKHMANYAFSNGCEVRIISRRGVQIMTELIKK